MRNNRTLLAAAGFVILALIYYFTQTGSVDTKAIDSELFRIKRDLIGSVQLNNSSGTLVLEKGPDAWTLDNYPADTLKISSLLTQFSDLTVDRLITKNADKYTQYEVGEHGNSILILRADGFPLLELILGKQGANYGETFVRDPTDDQVFAVKANLSQYKKMAPKDFWDRTFTHLELSEINTIEFSGEINYGIKREGPSCDERH
ncbi:MAG: DUF4340 domain-containing protein [Candidatus Marinimicrobia bacterium]|nr:DUF4340 domain-containing protein [Candidatus Neomarinimicrobiota bacterium]